MSDDPWRDITRPDTAELVNARRVDVSVAWGFFWARDMEGKCLLVLRHNAESAATGHLPRLRGIEVTETSTDGDPRRVLALRLLDSSHRDIFHRLCIDIVEGAAEAKSEEEAVETALARTWRWHHLLRGGGDDRLSPEEQKGLIGELLVLDVYLLSILSASDAIRAWRGPLGAPKDFEIGRTCIEAKARQGSARPYVAISSEFQLDTSGTDELFLHIVELDQAPSGAAGGFTVSDVVRRVRERLASNDQSVVEVFDGLLMAAGFRDAHDYTQWVWVEGRSRSYRVTPGFPSIVPEQFPAGVSAVKYCISLMECEPYRVDRDAVISALKQANNAN